MLNGESNCVAGVSNPETLFVSYTYKYLNFVCHSLTFNKK